MQPPLSPQRDPAEVAARAAEREAYQEELRMQRDELRSERQESSRLRAELQRKEITEIRAQLQKENADRVESTEKKMMMKLQALENQVKDVPDMLSKSSELMKQTLNN